VGVLLFRLLIFALKVLSFYVLFNSQLTLVLMTLPLLHRFGFFALFFFCLLGKTPQAKAQAYDMIYRDTLTAVSPGFVNHRFSFNLYQNCNPAPLNFTNIPVNYTAGGSPSSNEIIAGPLQFIGNGNPFCGNMTPACSATGPLNYQQTGVNYRFNVGLSMPVSGLLPLQTQIAALGSGFGNFTAANISGNFGIAPQTFNVVAAGMVNVAPEFVNPPVIFVKVNHPVSYSSGARDADGDSLVYRLRPVSPAATYAPGFTYLNPITANPALVLNSRTGVITFRPTVYNPATSPSATANKYVIGLDLDEYRKINGQPTRIGTIQRNILVNVISNTNNSPVLTAAQGNVPVAPNAIIDAFPGSQIRLDFGASDPDVFDVVVPISNALTVFPGATYNITLGANPNTGVLNWTPTPAQVRDEPYFFNVTAIDDACPYPASITYTYGIRVRNITGVSPDRGASAFLAYPNPSSGAVKFKLNPGIAVREIRIFNLLGQEMDKLKVAGNDSEVSWENAGKHVAGTYLARLISEDKTLRSLKFTKLQ
jgi:hypothetical protein